MYSRIAIIGAPGTGKTTLANNLSEIYNIPATHIDGIHHLPNWQQRDKEERDTMILNIANQEKWIIDGTYRATLKTRLEKADFVIWLDFSTVAQIRGIMQRYLKNKGVEKAEIPGCREKMDKEFFTYVLKYNKTKRKTIVENLEGIDKEKILVLKNRRQVNKWLENQKAKINN